MSNPVTVGVTGGIGTGKSVVCHLFSILGIPVYYADQRARMLSDTDASIKELIKSEFGEVVFYPDGTLNRSYLANIVFNNPEKLTILNNIIHPVVDKDFRHWIDQNADAIYVIKEAALLVETGSYKNLNFLVTVFSDAELRIKRILARDSHRTREEIEAIISHQTNDEEKFAVSQFRIDNAETKLLLPQVLKIHEFLVNLNQSG